MDRERGWVENWQKCADILNGLPLVLEVAIDFANKNDINFDEYGDEERMLFILTTMIVGIVLCHSCT